MRVALVCVVLMLVAPAAAVAARPTLGVVDVATGHRTAVVRGAAGSEGWTSVRWTPDGSALVAVRLERRGLVVRRYAIAGGTRKLRDLGDALDGVLNWDGTLVAALYDAGNGIPGGRGGVAVRDVATGRVRFRLPQYAEGDDLYENGLEVAWSRDGSRLAYLAEERRGRTLRIVDVGSGRVLRRVAADNLYLGPEPFSPSGDRMAYAVGNYEHLALLDVGSGKVRRRAESQIYPVAWAPADERLAGDAQGGVVVSDEQQRFGPPQAMPEEEAVELIRWSPDGTRLALLIQEFRYDRSKLAVMPVSPAPGPARIVIPYRASGLGGIQWSPDSRRIAYSG